MFIRIYYFIEGFILARQKKKHKKTLPSICSLGWHLLKGYLLADSRFGLYWRRKSSRLKDPFCWLAKYAEPSWEDRANNVDSSDFICVNNSLAPSNGYQFFRAFFFFFFWWVLCVFYDRLRADSLILIEGRCWYFASFMEYWITLFLPFKLILGHKISRKCWFLWFHRSLFAVVTLLIFQV